MSTMTNVPETGKHRAGKPGKPAKRSKAVKEAKAAPPVEEAQEATALEASHEPQTPGTHQAERKQRRPIVRLVGLLIVVAVTIGSAVGGFLLHRSNSHIRSLRAVESARQDAVAAAGQDVPKILGYDYRNLSADIKGAKALATGQFLSDYSATAQKVLASAPSVKAIVTATVADESVVQAQSDRVTLLMFVDQESVKQLSGQKTATTRIDPFRVQVTMSKVHGRWMVSDLEPI